MSRRAAPTAARILGRMRSVLGRVPRPAWICALIACLNAACWSVITPPFQVPDEPAHFAYIQQIAETGSVPAGNFGFSEEEETALRDLDWREVRWHPEKHPVVSEAHQRRLEEDLAAPLQRFVPNASSHSPGGAEPPLYYVVQTIPYLVGSGGTLLDRLELMRLVSALMAALTALFAYLFVREALPGSPWASAVGGLCVALAPLLGFMSGAVNTDAMISAVAAALFYLLARAFRRGLTPKLAVAIGIVTAIGFLTKSNFVGLVPGVILGLVVLARRAAPTAGRSAYRSLALAVAIAVSPVCLYVLINLLSNHAGLGEASRALHRSEGGSVLDEASYIWQLYLPRLPGMSNYFPGVSTTIQIWFNGAVGRYGWLDASFPGWVDRIALIATGLLAILAIRALITVRATLRRRLVELAVYAVMGAGLLAVLGAAQYATYVAKELEDFGQARYLLPMLSLLGAALALSARGAGRRWGPAVGALIVVLFLSYDVFSQLQVIARYYG